MQDVITHTTELMALLVSAVSGRAPQDGPVTGIEQVNEVAVHNRAEWTPHDTLNAFSTQFAIAEPVIASLQVPTLATAEAPLLDLGTYPLHAIADMFAFDLTTHLRWDVLAPRGPVLADVGEPTDAQLAGSLNWLTAGIAQMQPELIHALLVPIGLRFTGPAGRAVTVRPRGDSIVVGDGIDDDVWATVTSAGIDALAWMTTRRPWLECTEIDGDVAVTAKFLDALDLV